MAAPPRPPARPCEQHDISLRVSLLGNRCLCSLKLRRFEEGRCDAQEAVLLDPHYAKGFYRLALCQKECADLAGAWESADRAAQLAPEDADAQALLRLIQRLESGWGPEEGEDVPAC